MNSETESHRLSKAELVRVMRRLGIAESTIAEIANQVSDPVDLNECGALLQRYGLTRDAVVSRMGGSP